MRQRCCWAVYSVVFIWNLIVFPQYNCNLDHFSYLSYGPPLRCKRGPSDYMLCVCSVEKLFICDINHVPVLHVMPWMKSKMCFVSLGNRFSGPIQTGEMCAITSVRQLHPTLLKAPLHAFCSPFTCYYIQLCHLIESCYQSSCPDVTLNILSATSPEPDSAWVDI